MRLVPCQLRTQRNLPQPLTKRLLAILSKTNRTLDCVSFRLVTDESPLRLCETLKHIFSVCPDGFIRRM